MHLRLAILSIVSACAASPSPSVATAGPRTTTPTSRPASRPRPAATPRDREVGDVVGVTAAHNRVRASVGVEPLVWSSALARHAQQWADHLQSRGCELEHRPSGADRYGENLFWSSGSATPDAVVDNWASERSGYDPAKNRCRGVCGHYTQVVWRRSTRLGCGVARCGAAELWVCNYDPPGNVVGEPPY